MRFTLTENHIKLLRAMWVNWQDCETGAPEIDPKRPYGNSDVESDIHELLTGECGLKYELTCEQRQQYANLHRETQYALQIVLSVGEMKVGTYETFKPYNRQEWRPVT